MIAILKADARKIPLADESVQMVCTSPPYWGLRKYAGEQELVWGGRDCEHEFGPTGPQHHPGQVKQTLVGAGPSHEGQTAGSGQHCNCGAWRGAYGLEPTVEIYVQHTVEILREIRRVLRDDGVCFLNIGDSYWSATLCRDKPVEAMWGNRPASDLSSGRKNVPDDNKRGALAKNQGALKPKDLCLIPFRVALAAQADGWWVRSDIIWAKPNPMTESVTDRPTRSHEYILMLTKSAKYYWDAEAVKESAEYGRGTGPCAFRSQKYIEGRASDDTLASAAPPSGTHAHSYDGKRNLRSVWDFPTQPYPEAHFATFPEELPKRCILAATRTGDLVLDPFAGSGTVGKVAIELGRRAILCDLAYQDLALKRTSAVQRPLLEIFGA